jgi:hypothetical protein
LVALATGSGAELFHDPMEGTYLTREVDGHRQTMSLEGGEIKKWLAREGPAAAAR